MQIWLCLTSFIDISESLIQTENFDKKKQFSLCDWAHSFFKV